MGLSAIQYVQASCDYSIHIGNRPLPHEAVFHRLFNDTVICTNCWDNLMTVESLLDLVKVPHTRVRIDEIRDDYFKVIDA